MNFQQLRTFRELTRQGFSLTSMASVSHTTQPGISRQIRDLESELGLAVFERQGKRITGLSEAGAAMLQIVERLLDEADRLHGAWRDYTGARSGTLAIATTHTQARYALPPAVLDFRARFPQVRIELHQGASEQIARSVAAGTADIGIGCEALARHPDLAVFPCYTWRYRVVVTAGHPLLACAAPTLADLARYPIVTYDCGLSGRRQVDAAFAAAGFVPDIVLSSLDSDVIKQYVGLGLGIGLLAPMAFDASEDGDKGLRSIDAGALFAPGAAVLAVRRGAWLRAYTYAFIQRFAPHLTRAAIDAVVHGGDNGAAPAAAAPAAPDYGSPELPRFMRKAHMHEQI